jgi:hypothetical protein
MQPRAIHSSTPHPAPRSLLLVFLLTATLLGCTKSEECDTCSKDEDCDVGFVCSTFNDGSQRCGAGTGATMCRVR